MGMVITFFSDSLAVDLGGLSNERKKARIKISEVRSLVASTDNSTVGLVFSNGEIYGFPYEVVDSIDGDTEITSQDILYNKIEAKLFAAT